MCDNHPEDAAVNEDLLEFARAWKKGYTLPVHPSIGRRLNHSLIVAHEDPVPLTRATNGDAPSLAELLFREHALARVRVVA